MLRSEVLVEAGRVLRQATSRAEALGAEVEREVLVEWGRVHMAA